MGRELSSEILLQIANKTLKPKFIIKINGTDYSDYLKSANVSFTREYGSASGQFILRNPDDIFGVNGTYALHVGDTVEYFEQIVGDATLFSKFYGKIESRSFVKTAGARDITLNCLDFIAVLKNTSISLSVEGNKVKVENEVLEPQFFTDTGNTMFAQIFNFANSSIAQDPPVILTIRDKSLKTDDTQFDGFDILYSSGQVKLGSPLNAEDNYDLVSKSYYTYTSGIQIEDVIEQIIKAADGYNKYLFDETSAANVVANHLTSSFLAEEGRTTDTLVPNYSSQEITISHALTASYNPTQLVTGELAADYDFNSHASMTLTDASSFPDPGGANYTIIVNGFSCTYTGKSSNTLTGVTGSYYINSGASVVYDTGVTVTTLTVDSTEGFPDTGSATIAGDTFTWSSKDATHLYGVPTTGENSLFSKPVGANIDYKVTYAIGQVWYLSFNRISTALVTGNFTFPGGSSVKYIDLYFGRVILNSAISLSSTVTCNVDYNFSSIQATGVEINRIDFTERETENKFEAIQKCRQFLAPNYIIRTKGNNKIYGRYLYQKHTPDYDLNLITGLDYFEDSDLYTRVIFFGKNKNPQNILFNEGVQFITSGESYKSFASNDDLIFKGTADGWHSFETSISRAGYITADSIVPAIYINNILVDNQPHLVVAQPVTIEKTTKTVTVTSSDKGGSSTSQSVYYYYELQFAHQSILSTEPVYIYDSSGVLQYTLSPGSTGVDYSRGTWAIPGDQKNETVENLSTATYTIFYANDQIRIDYDNVVFYIKQTLIPDATRVVVNADYEYIHTMTAVNGITKVLDGRWDTQVQTEFFSNPPSGYNYAILDLGQVYTVQALDMIAGFYKPDEIRKFDIGMRISLQYSLDNLDYYYISDACTAFEMRGGTSKTFEENDLGVGFQARYLKLILDNVSKIDFTETGTWVVAFTEISAYADVVLKSEAKLIPIAYTEGTVNSSTTTITVDSTLGFTDPGSGETITAYIDDNDFTYTGLTTTSFTGVTIGGGESYSTATIISKSVKADADVYDFTHLLYYQGDRLYKQSRVSDEVLYTQTELDNLARAWLSEFVKQHTSVQASVLFCPYINIGHTIAITDPESLVETNYFVESIASSNGKYVLTASYYPE